MRMKTIFFGIFLLFTSVLAEVDYTLEEISEKHERKLYDVRQLALDVAENIETLNAIDRERDFLMSNNVQNKVQMLNFLKLLPLLINGIGTGNDSNSKCVKDLSYIRENINFQVNQDSWALRMLDSFGKPESGILAGNIKWLGDFDECKKVYAPKKESNNDIGGYYGHYCTLGVTAAKLIPLSIGICLPDSCNSSESLAIFRNSNLIPALNQSGLELNITSLICKVNSLEISNGGIATLCIISLFVFLALLGSSITVLKYFIDSKTTKEPGHSSEVSNGHASKSRDIEILARNSNSTVEEPHDLIEGSPSKLTVMIDKCDPFLNCFCIFTNGAKLLNTDATEGQLLCLHGIRFLSMTWVILCHGYTSTTTSVRSLRSTLTLVDNLPFQAVLNGWFSVDSFFLLSGFLLSYLYFQDKDKRPGKTPWVYFYVHRYLRLTPVYMIVLAFVMNVMTVMGSGPFWPNTNVDVGCQNGWWWNLLYVNNLLQDPKANNQCMGWSWYLANDMQFFVISPLFLITLLWKPIVGFLCMLFFLCANWITGFLITYQNNLVSGAISDVRVIASDPNFMARFNEYMQKSYIKPYCRIAPYIIGIGLGYILFKRIKAGSKSDRKTLWIGWLLAVPAGLYCVYGVYHQTPNLVGASFYNAFTRTLYGASLSWLIFVCLSGQGVLDAFGKPESGILDGNLKFIGDFDECKSVYAPKEKDGAAGDFHGRYCSLTFKVSLLPTNVKLGICLPDTCNPSDFNAIFNESIIDSIPILKQIGFKINSFSCKPDSLQLSNGGIVTIFVISIFLLLVLLGSSITAFKYFSDTKDTQDKVNLDNVSIDNVSISNNKETSVDQLAIAERSPSKLRNIIDKCDPFLNCFCIFTNGSKLLNTDATEGQLLCLHGIRFLSMTWVILCHVYVPNFDLIRSLKNVLPKVDTLPFQAVLNGWYSVDSFFVLSGFLMSYLYFQDCSKRKGNTPWLYFYIHRYLRLTPVYMIVLAFYATVLPVMGSGPFWHDTNVDQNCRKNWWWNLLYINNFQKNVNQCFALTWYLANDMQFFALSPLFLITLWRWPKIGFSALAVFLCGSWLCGFIITFNYDLVAGSLGDIRRMETEPNFLNRFLDYMDKIYYKPYTRIAPYLIGIALGYFIFKRKDTNTKISSNTLWIGWLISTVAGLYCVYGTYHQTPNLVAASFYNAFTRTIYGLSLSWLIFVCLSGQGGVVDKILSYKLFIPLSRLTYCAYLLHVILMDIYTGNQRTTQVFSHQTMVIMFLGLLVSTYAFSMLVSLMFESPLIRLEKLLRSKSQPKSRN